MCLCVPCAKNANEPLLVLLQTPIIFVNFYFCNIPLEIINYVILSLSIKVCIIVKKKGLFLLQKATVLKLFTVLCWLRMARMEMV